MPKKGDTNAEGLIFYRRKRGSEVWLTPEAFAKRAESDSAWKKQNYSKKRGEILQKAKDYYNRKKDTEAHKQANRTRAAKYRKEHPEKARAAIKRWEAAHPEILKATKRRWVEKNPEAVKAIRITAESNRRSRKKSNGGKITHAEMLAIKRKANGVCYYCKKKAKNLTFDHIQPISKGGKHEASNLVMACFLCNSTKNNQDPMAYARKIGRLLI